MTAETLNERAKTEINRQLDLELEGTFPASDPLTITRFPRRPRTAKTPSRDAGGHRSSHRPHDVLD